MQIIENKILKTVDSIINHANTTGLFIEYIALSHNYMLSLATDVSVLMDRGVTITSLSRYRETSLREVEHEGILVKYRIEAPPWIEIDYSEPHGY